MWILVGALIGAIAGAAGSIISAKLQGQDIDWNDVAAASVTGAITGAVASATLGVGLLASPVGRTAVGATFGAAASGGQTMLDNELHGRPVMDGVQNAVISGAAGGALTGLVLSPVAAELPAALLRTTVGSAAGNATARAADNVLEGRPVLDGVGVAAATGAVVGGGTHLAVAGSHAATERFAPKITLRPTTTLEPVPPQSAQKGLIQILENLDAPSGHATAVDAAPKTTPPAAPTNATAPVAAKTPAQQLVNRPLGGDDDLIPASQDSTRQHIFEGGTETSPQSPYAGKWDGTGIHDWDSLVRRVDQDGFNIAGVTEDPATGARRVTVQRVGADPKTGQPVTGNVTKTMYPRSMTPAEIEAAGERALQDALAGSPGATLDPFDPTKLNKDGTPKNGAFESTVPTSAGPIKVQGWYRSLPDGSHVITSHAPAFLKASPWPTLAPTSW